MNKFEIISFFNKNKNYWWALLLFAIFWFAFLGFSGTLTSGFHFTDDHGIVSIKHSLQSQNTLSIIIKWINDDQQLTHRFRPLYFLHRVIETRIFNTNFIAWSIYNAFLAILTSFFLYYFFRLLKFSFLESLMFPLLVLFGPQISVWWRLGPQEFLGMFLLSFSLFFLGLYITSQDKKIFKTLFVILAILMALSKESFILFLPACGFLLTYLSNKESRLSLIESIKRNLGSLLTLAIAFIGILAYIKIFLGTGGVGYAGIDGFDYKAYYSTFLSLTNSWFGWLLAAAFFFNFLGFFLEKKNKEKDSKFIIDLLWLAGLFFIIVLPQVVLYAKSGFFERYMLPVIIGYFLVYFFLLRKMNGKLIIARICLLLIAAYFLQGEIRGNFHDAKDFAKDGRNIGSLFYTVAKKTSLDSRILIVGDPAMYFEWADSINFYLRDELERENIFIYALQKRASYSDFNKQLIKGFGIIYGQNRYENTNNKNYDAIIIFPKMEKTFLNNFSNPESLNKENFTQKDFGGYVIYYKNK